MTEIVGVATADARSLSEWEASSIGGSATFVDRATAKVPLGAFVVELAGGVATGSSLSINFAARAALSTRFLLCPRNDVGTHVLARIVASTGGSDVTVEHVIDASLNEELRLRSNGVTLATAPGGFGDWFLVSIAVSDSTGAWRFRVQQFSTTTMRWVADNTFSGVDAANINGQYTASRIEVPARAAGSTNTTQFSQHLVSNLYNDASVIEGKDVIGVHLLPNATLASGWTTAVPAVAHHLNVDEDIGTNDGDTSYIESATSGQVDRFDVSDPTMLPSLGTIALPVLYLTVWAVARQSGTTATGGVTSGAYDAANNFVAGGAVQRPPSTSYVYLRTAGQARDRSKALLDGITIRLTANNTLSTDVIRVTATGLIAVVAMGMTLTEAGAGSDSMTARDSVLVDSGTGSNVIGPREATLVEFGSGADAMGPRVITLVEDGSGQDDHSVREIQTPDEGLGIDDHFYLERVLLEDGIGVEAVGPRDVAIRDDATGTDAQGIVGIHADDGTAPAPVVVAASQKMIIVDGRTARQVAGKVYTEV